MKRPTVGTGGHPPTVPTPALCLSWDLLHGDYPCGGDWESKCDSDCDFAWCLWLYRIPLPPWVHDAIDKDNDIVYTDKSGRRNREYLSLSVDDLPVLHGRTPIQAYSDFMRSFRDCFKDYLGSVITVRHPPCGMPGGYTPLSGLVPLRMYASEKWL